MKLTSPPVIALAATALVAAAAWRADRASFAAERSAACAAIGAPTLDHGGVRIILGSKLSRDGKLSPGHVARCDERADATRAFEVVRDAVARARWPDLPAVTVHFAPEGRARTSTHIATSELVLGRDDSLHPTILAHEIAHVAVLSRRSSAAATETARRVVAVIDEAVADYAASVVTGTAQLGDPARGPMRDLTQPPRVSVAGWAALASTGAGFDPHLLGWDLAAALHARAPGDHTMKDDVAAASALAFGESIAEVLTSFVRACPPRSRARLRAALADSIPGEFLIE